MNGSPSDGPGRFASIARRDRLIALLIGVLATLALHRASRTEGFTRDEAYYFHAAEDRWGWFLDVGEGLRTGHPLRAFSRPSVDRWFNFNHEHPELMKMLSGISWGVLHKCDCPHQSGRHPINYTRRHKTLALMSESQAFRFPAHVFGGLLAALVYLFGARAFSRRAGLVAAVLALAVPQMFFHAELACFDAPVATTWLLCVYCYWRSLSDARFSLWTGITFGLALATKHNGFFLPFVLGAHWLWMQRHELRHGHLPRIPGAFWWMAILGPVVEIALWPWMWFDALHVGFSSAGVPRVWGRFPEYLGFHLNHVYYNMEYLGRNYNKPPFPKTYAFVMTLFTTPVTTLALATLGGLSLLFGARLWRHLPAPPPTRSTNPGEPPPPPVWIWKPAPVGMAMRPDPNSLIVHTGLSTGALITLNAVFPLCVIAFTGAPIFGGTKHWLAALPFIALLAGAGLDFASRLAEHTLGGTRRQRRGVLALAVVLACAPAVAETWRAQPYGLTHYNLLAGGPAGGADLGLNRQFWGYSTRGLLPWMNVHAPGNANVYWHDTNQDILNMDVREKLLRPDILNTGLEEPGVRQSTLALVIHERHFNKYEYWIWDFYGTARPSQVLTLEGVPIVTLYERPLVNH